jgi:cell division protein FtsQ
MARRRKKKKHRIYALIVILLGIAILAAAFVLLFYVQKIEIQGNEYTDDQVILETVQDDPLSVNSVYLLWKNRFKDTEIPGSLSSMKISLKSPWTVKVTVKEKPIIGYFCLEDQYVFFDKEGTVVCTGQEMVADVPCIEGIEISEAKLYQPLQVKSEKLLTAILDAAQEVVNYELTPDRILCSDDGISLYFGQVCVMLGTNITTEKMAQITPILAKLEGKSGTLHLEHYTSDSNTITFTEDAVEDVSAEESTDTESTDAETADGEVSYEDTSGDEYYGD